MTCWFGLAIQSRRAKKDNSVKIGSGGPKLKTTSLPSSLILALQNILQEVSNFGNSQFLAPAFLMAFCSALTHPVIELAKMCQEDSILDNLESEMKEGPPSRMAHLLNFICGCLENWLHNWQAEEIVEVPRAPFCFRCLVLEPGFFCRVCRYVRYCGEVCKIIFKNLFEIIWNVMLRYATKQIGTGIRPGAWKRWVIVLFWKWLCLSLPS